MIPLLRPVYCFISHLQVYYWFKTVNYCSTGKMIMTVLLVWAHSDPTSKEKYLYKFLASKTEMGRGKILIKEKKKKTSKYNSLVLLRSNCCSYALELSFYPLFPVGGLWEAAENTDTGDWGVPQWCCKQKWKRLVWLWFFPWISYFLKANYF